MMLFLFTGFLFVWMYIYMYNVHGYPFVCLLVCAFFFLSGFLMEDGQQVFYNFPLIIHIHVWGFLSVCLLVCLFVCLHVLVVSWQRTVSMRFKIYLSWCLKVHLQSLTYPNMEVPEDDDLFPHEIDVCDKSYGFDNLEQVKWADETRYLMLGYYSVIYIHPWMPLHKACFH